MKKKDKFKLEINKTKKRKLKKGETEYPRYEFKTIEELFDILTEENMNRFFKDFKVAMSASVYYRAMIYAVAKEKAEKDGVQLPKATEVMKMPTFTWIDD